MYGLFILFSFFSLSMKKYSIYKIIDTILIICISVQMILVLLRSYNILQINHDKIIILNKTLLSTLWLSIIIDLISIFIN